MKIFKRAWISIIRRKANSLVLLLIVFLLANILLTTLSVTTSLKETQKTVLKQFPPIVNIDINYDNDDENWKLPNPTADMAEKLYAETSDIVKSYDYSLVLGLYKNSSIKSPTISTSDEINEMLKAAELNILTIYGSQLSQPSLVLKNEGKLINGKGFSESDIKEGKPKIIVTKQFADSNGLEVGSFISLERKLFKSEDYSGAGLPENSPYFSETIDLEVTGIIEINSVEKYIKQQEIKPDNDVTKANEIQQIANTVYSTNSFLNPLVKDNVSRSLEADPDQDEESLGFKQPTIVTPEYILKDMNDLDKFTKTAENIYNKNDYTIISAAKEYEVIAKPLKATEDLLDLVFKITVVASIVILSLVLCIFMYLRQKEMGIFLALGEKRKKIILQLLIETLIITLIGTTLAIFSSIIFSNILSQNTINSLLAPSNISTNVSTTFNSDYGLTPEFISNQYQGGFSIITILFFYLVMILTTIISQIATALYLLRLNPKKILM